MNLNFCVVKLSAFAYLVYTLRFVASSATVQLKLYLSGVCVTDEIALDYHDTLLYVDSRLEKNKVYLSVYGALKELDDEFGNMSAISSLWTEKALKLSNEWANTRRMALVILENMGEKYKKPSSPTDTFII